MHFPAPGKLCCATESPEENTDYKAMMKLSYKHYLSVLALFAACKSAFPPAPPLPEMVDLSGTSQAYQEYIHREYPKGAMLFQKHCAPCHGIFNAHKEDVPDFSKVKIDAYNLSFLAGDSTNHAVAKGISQADFELIMLFLTYRKAGNP